MSITVGTFNLNNVFSRFNFRAGLTPGRAAGDSVSVDAGELRTQRNRIVLAKPASQLKTLARRIRERKVTVLAVQEVEHRETLERFNRDHLKNLYSSVALLEGNDPRRIDVGVVSMLPLGGVTSWRHTKDERGVKVFGRDLLEVEVLSSSGKRRLSTLFNAHFKSQFVPYDKDPVSERARSDARRKAKATAAARIIEARTRPDSAYIVAGDLNDVPSSRTPRPRVLQVRHRSVLCLIGLDR